MVAEPYPHRIFMTIPSNSNRHLQIPVPPETIAGGTGSIINTFNLITLGEVLSQGGIQLERVKFQSHFPAVYDPSVEVVTAAEHINPLKWRDLFASVQRNQALINVAINGAPIDMNMAISRFQWAFVPGPSGDIWYQIELIQAKQGVIRQFNGISFPERSDINRDDPSVDEKLDSELDESFDSDFWNGETRMYRLRPGDTLQSISLLFYGTTRYDQSILSANGRFFLGEGFFLGGEVNRRRPSGEIPEGVEFLGGLFPGGFLPDDWRITDVLIDPKLPAILSRFTWIFIPLPAPFLESGFGAPSNPNNVFFTEF